MGNFLENAKQPVALRQGHSIKRANMQDEARTFHQSKSELDLTTSDQVKFSLPVDELEAGEGYDSAKTPKAIIEFSEAVSASSQVPEVNIEDEDGNSTGLAFTNISDGDPKGGRRVAEISGGSKAHGVDLSSKELHASVSQVASDASDTAGTAKLWVSADPDLL